MSEQNTIQDKNQTAPSTPVIEAPAPVESKPTEPEASSDNSEELVVDELMILKERARKLGVSFHPNIGLETLRDKINQKLRASDLKDVSLEAGVPNMNDVQATEPVSDYSAAEIANGYATRDTGTLSKAQLRNEAIKDANKLVRVRINCMNPNKRDWEGEIITVANAVVGTFRKFIPFNNTEGYHVPQIILQAIRERQCQIFVNGTNAQGQRSKRPTLINEFAVEVMPPLTTNELKELAQRQAMANGTAQ
jgi:hypothetical protein